MDTYSALILPIPVAQTAVPKRKTRAKLAERERARELRRQGWTYQRIAAELGVSSSSCSLWLRDLPHPPPRRNVEAMWQARWASVLAQRAEERRQTKIAAFAELGEITNRDLLIAGAVAYWCEGEKVKEWAPRERVAFINSDPALIRMFVRFLALTGIESEQVRYRVCIHETADVAAAEQYWAGIVGVPRERLARTTLKRHNPLTKRKNTGATYRGCLSIIVLRSATLYQRIEGWFNAVAQ